MKRSFFQTGASFFALYGILFIPFPFYFISFQSDLTGLLFGKLIGFVSATISGRPLNGYKVYSDSTSMYILVLLLFVLAVITALLVSRLPAWPALRPRVLRLAGTICVYYLALQLLKYGVDKVFKNQFYLPEPNILYTPVGRLDKDMLYWSSMGTSHFYNVCMGILECLAAFFLFFRRTRLVGLLMSLAILLNVVAINFGFDIGVKLFSLFLLFLTGYLLAPYTKTLFQALTQQAITGNTLVAPVKRTFWTSFMKCFVIGLLLLEAIFPFIRTRNFNDDLAQRPYLHGAYQVNEMIIGSDTLASATFPVKRFFVHRDGYIIFQDQQDQMQDYKLSPAAGLHNYVMTDYQLRKVVVSIVYNGNDSQLVMNYSKGGVLTRVNAKAIDWRKLPLLKKGFHWTTD